MTEAERDRYLQEALRHAPDADAAAPPTLSAAILREAHAAVASPIPRGTRGVRGWLAAAWAAMASPRLAGALASLMVLTLAGVMWWGRPIDPALPVREPPVAAVPPAVTLTPAATAPAAKDAPLEVRAEKVEKAERAERAERAESKRSEPPARQRAPAAPAAPSALAEPSVAGAGLQDKMVAAPVPAEVIPAPAPTQLAARVATPRGNLLGAAMAPHAALGTGTGPTSWDRGDGRTRPVDAAFEAFLAQLDASVGGVPAPARKAAGAVADTASAPPLNLQRNGQPLRTLRIEGDVLSIETPGGSTQQIPLSPGSGASLAARLAELSR